MRNYNQILASLKSEGMDPKAATILVNKLRQDEEINSVTEDEKRWALSKGFLPGRIKLYGLTEDNYSKYIPDYQYHMLHPLNNHFKIWINDKLTLKYMLSNDTFRSLMPEYYAYVDNFGIYNYLMDCPFIVRNSKELIPDLLKIQQKIAIKPNSGTSGGYGFIKIEEKEIGFFENNKQVRRERIEEIQESLRNYIITEYIEQHKDLANIWSKSECTLRVIMCKNVKNKYESDQWTCATSYARFGTSDSGAASNLSAGGIGIGFDFETGAFREFGAKFKEFATNDLWLFREHPDSKINWEGFVLPHWEKTKEKIFEICCYFSSLSYLGLDIIISAEGPKICEINSFPAMDYEQVICGPALVNEQVSSFFKDKGLQDIDANLFYKICVENK